MNGIGDGEVFGMTIAQVQALGSTTTFSPPGSVTHPDTGAGVPFLFAQEWCLIGIIS